MHKILVVSDSHGNHGKLARIIAREYPFDCLVHCGDGVSDLFHVEVPEDVTVVRVSGNIDLVRSIDMERIALFEAGSARFMVAHGDQFGVHNDYGLIEREGRNRKADAVLFGHTHIKYLRDGKPALFNPGPANSGMYGLVIVNGTPRFSHGRLED
jgi:putative phosphoesterase